MLAARPTTLMEAVPAKRLQHQAKTNSLQHHAEGYLLLLHTLRHNVLEKLRSRKRLTKVIALCKLTFTFL